MAHKLAHPGILQGVKQYADYENMIAEWISRRFRGCYDYVTAVMGSL